MAKETGDKRHEPAALLNKLADEGGTFSALGDEGGLRKMNPLRSFPRKRESAGCQEHKNWVPAFAGTSGHERWSDL